MTLEEVKKNPTKYRYNFNELYTYRMSGSSLGGNSQQRVWDSIRKDGLLPQRDLPKSTDITKEEYVNYVIPQNLKDKAKNIFNYFNFQYEWVSYAKPANIKDMSDSLRQCPLQIVTPVCNWYNPVIDYCGNVPPRHAIMAYSLKDIISIFDSYPTYRKKMSLSYYIPYVLKGIVSPVVKDKPKYVFNKNLSFGMRNVDVFNLQRCLKYLNLFVDNQNYSVSPTGYYGLITKNAVSKFQYQYKIASDYVLRYNGGNLVGISTRAKLNEIFGDVPITPKGSWITSILKRLIK